MSNTDAFNQPTSLSFKKTSIAQPTTVPSHPGDNTKLAAKQKIINHKNKVITNLNKQLKAQTAAMKHLSDQLRQTRADGIAAYVSVENRLNAESIDHNERYYKAMEEVDELLQERNKLYNDLEYERTYTNHLETVIYDMSDQQSNYSLQLSQNDSLDNLDNFDDLDNHNQPDNTDYYDRQEEDYDW